METSFFASNILGVFMFFINILLICGIIVIAAIKKLNMAIWTLLPLIGFFVLGIIQLILNIVYMASFVNYNERYYDDHLFYSEPVVNSNIIFFLIRLITPTYLVILLFIALIKRGNQVVKPTVDVNRCPNCQYIINENMHFCPSCGTHINKQISY